MAWQRLGEVALRVTAASAAAAALRAREAAHGEPQPASPAADRPALFSRVAVVSSPVPARVSEAA